ncbi:DUF2924 domain-containing protein [Frigidibacter sp. RF13]|uniref:DUF2924 domain-containing protein n=1 Tax=Frigidibacter sp. RF13 TaxID=2997340 RepID=UPI002270E273|nr:DUF2924 domain-containing protein [Frigidibacter sp. RF13]MCY1128624.1 DUF2924 domain-containing protein [Frigidibacter sp. RF13]
MGDSLLADLAGPDRDGLKRLWEETVGCPPPRYLAPEFMARVIAHERQVKALGGLTATERRALRMMAEGRSSPEAAATALGPSSGAQIVRDWNGRSYRVEVLADGYRFDGKTYRSLSSIAKRITGTNWSGPRFFGLVSRRAAGGEIREG